MKKERTERIDMRITLKQKFALAEMAKREKRTITSLVEEAIDNLIIDYTHADDK